MSMNLENTGAYRLSDETLESLLLSQTLCVMNWSTKEGWPMGATQMYIWYEQRIWTTSASTKGRISALSARPQSAIVISGVDTPFTAERGVSIKCCATVHKDEQTIARLLPRFAERSYPDDAQARAIFMSLLDSPLRVVVEHEPLAYFSYDGVEMARALRANAQSSGQA